MLVIRYVCFAIYIFVSDFTPKLTIPELRWVAKAKYLSN